MQFAPHPVSEPMLADGSEHVMLHGPEPHVICAPWQDETPLQSMVQGPVAGHVTVIPWHADVCEHSMSHAWPSAHVKVPT